MKLSEPKRVDYYVAVILLCWMWSMPCLGGAENTTTLFLNTTGDGLWGTAANWSLDAVPTATNHAVINNGRVATVAANSPGLVDTITVGNDAVSNTALHIEAALSVNTFRVASAPNAVGHVQQTHGGVSVSKELQIAATDAGADTGTYTISGGRLSFYRHGHLTIGTQGQGRFTVEGSSPAGISGTRVTLGRQGTLEFRLGMLGVTSLGLIEMLTVDPGGQLVVDGSAYEGLDGYFPLILTNNVTGGFESTNVVFTGFGGREPALVLQDDGLWLRLIAPPAFSTRLCSLVPDSTVTTDYDSTAFSATRALEPTVSAWTPTLNEAHVMDTQLSQDVLGGGAASDNLSWQMRVGRGGHLYSLRIPSIGETVPPSWRSDLNSSPWNDEVWQGVAVDTALNNAPESRYFIHQSGVYLKDPIQEEPFYSPQVAADLDVANRSFTTINWGQHAHVNNYTDADPNDDFQSHLLYYTRYRDLGQGVIEVSLGFYNYGPDNPNYFNMPWGGVRRTSTEYAFLSEPGGAGWSEAIEDNFGSGALVKYADTGGSIAFSASNIGDTPALGLAFGFDPDPLLTNQPSTSLLRYGYAGGAYQPEEATWRNYFVISAVRKYDLTQGRGVWARYYFVLGDDLQDLTSRIASRNLAENATLSEFNYTEATTPLVGYTFTGSGPDFRITKNDLQPQLWLYAHPVSNSFPIYEIIENDNSRYLTWNPYATGVIKTYDGTIAGIRLLGFALRNADVNSGGTSYAYERLAALMSGTPSNYIAAGEDLSVRSKF